MKNSTRIIVLLDRSGSMSSRREETVTGLNKFIEDQKSLPDEATLKLVQFDSHAGLQYDTTFDTDIKSAPVLTSNDYEPRGLTPLLDAQGKLINELGNELSALPETERPSKVIVVTITDGIENASTDFTATKIKEMIKHQTEVYNWDFVYLGANQDAVAVGATMGIIGAKSMSYNIADPAAYANTYTNTSSYLKRARRAPSGQSVRSNTFTEQERSSSMGEDK